MENVENESKRYKIYLIILGVFAIISLIIGYFMYSALVEQKSVIDDIYETIVNGGEEASNEVINQFNESIENEEDKLDKETIVSTLDQMKKGDIYVMLEEGKDPDVISILSMQYLCLFNGFMIIVLCFTALEKRFLKGLNKVLRIILNIVVVVLLVPYSVYVIALGAIGLPIAIVYYIYKYIKTKKDKNKDTDDCINVMGKVDADEIFDKNDDETKE